MAATDRPARGRATLASVGGPGPTYRSDVSDAELASEMARFWAEQIAAVLPSKPDLILLPELADRFRETPPARLAELRAPIGDEMLAMLRDVARKNQCYVAYPTAYQGDANLWHNGIRMLDRQGIERTRYAKNFLVKTEVERGLTPGSGPVVYDCDFGRVGFAVCFDLNFTELLPKYRALSPDLLLFPSNYHGGLMQPYWAYQLRAHLLACMGLPSLRSTLYAPTGQLLASSTNYFHHFVSEVNLDCALVHLDFHWEKLRALKEHFGKQVTITDPGELGAVLVSSENPNLAVSAMLDAFGIITLDMYLEQSRACNAAARPSFL